jgi:hypothetical protein
LNGPGKCTAACCGKDVKKSTKNQENTLTSVVMTPAKRMKYDSFGLIGEMFPTSRQVPGPIPESPDKQDLKL